MNTTPLQHEPSFSSCPSSTIPASGAPGAGGGASAQLQLQHCGYGIGAGASGINNNNNNNNVPNAMSQAGTSAGNNLTNGQQRSTRGASKQRRDQINVEIQKLRDLLPLSDLIKDRLFQLQVMSLGCIFIRKHRYQQTSLQPAMMQMSLPMPRGVDICKALRGFMLMVTRSGKILHVSDNASEYLGHSVEEIMCQGDSIYDLVDGRDHGAVQAELTSGPPVAANFPEERVFICRLNLARTAKRQLQYHKFVLFQGRYIQPAEFYQQLTAQSGAHADCDQPVFSAYCQPLINPENAEGMSTGNTNIFCTQHFLDMKFKEADAMACHHLGYGKEQLKGASWYGMLHPSHVPELAHKHRLLCQEKEGSVLALLRLQTAAGDWIWLHTVFSIRPNSEINSEGKRNRHVIYCFHQKLSDLEAATLQANAWIYSMRHTYPTVFSCQDSPQPSEEQQPLSPPTPQPSMMQMEQKTPGGMAPPQGFPNIDYHQIKVEIPMRPIATQIPLFTPESSSPESSASLHTSLFPQNFQLDGLEDILPSADVLPELKDEVDEILRQVEQQSPEPPPPPPAVLAAHRHSMPNTFDTTAMFYNSGSTTPTSKVYKSCAVQKLYNYLGPALYNDTPPPDAHHVANHPHHHPHHHQHLHNQNLQNQMAPPSINNNNNNNYGVAQNHFLFHHHHHPHFQPHPHHPDHHFDYFNRKRSWHD